MANHNSALKRNRQNEKRNEQNKVRRTHIKNAIKSVLLELDEKNKAQAQNTLKETSRIISKSFISSSKIDKISSDENL